MSLMSKLRILFVLSLFLLIFLTLSMIIPNFSVKKSSAQNHDSPQTYGININYYDHPTGGNAWQNPNWIKGLENSGAKWVRFESRYYNQTIYETDSSKLNLKPLEMCKLVKQNGLKTLAVLDETVSPYVIDDFSAITGLDQWREIVKGQLVGYGKYLDAVEMWNEPDLVDPEEARNKNWYMDGTPEHYVDMLKILFEEVQNYNERNDVGIKVIAGALGTVRTLDPTELWDSGGFFLQAIVNLNADSYCDYFSIHVFDGYLYPYSDTKESEGLFDVEDAYRKAQDIVGDKPIWITELGANHAFTENAQVEFMSNVAFGPLRRTGCPLVFWYCYYNPRWEISDPNEALHGLVNQDDELTKRKHYQTFQEFALNPSINGPFQTEVDTSTIVISVTDGDTFETSTEGTIRLADIDAPEYWENYAAYIDSKDYLISILNGKTVYLDVDNRYVTDYYGTGNRTVCMVYLDYNSTHYLNVNQALVEYSYEYILNYENDFNPSDWTLYVAKQDIPEFPSWVVLALVLINTLFLVIIKRKLCARNRESLKD